MAFGKLGQQMFTYSLRANPTAASIYYLEEYPSADPQKLFSRFGTLEDFAANVLANLDGKQLQNCFGTIAGAKSLWLPFWALRWDIVFSIVLVL